VEAALGLEAVTRDRAAVGSYFLLVRLGCLGVERDIVEGGTYTHAQRYEVGEDFCKLHRGLLCLLGLSHLSNLFLRFRGDG
jgi:hypothetical protein